MAENVELEAGKMYQYFDQQWRIDKIQGRKVVVCQYLGKDPFNGREMFGDPQTWHTSELKLFRPIAGK